MKLAAGVRMCFAGRRAPVDSMCDGPTLRTAVAGAAHRCGAAELQDASCRRALGQVRVPRARA
jgi:hypothetical protein